jgi:hypothetical protein
MVSNGDAAQGLAYLGFGIATFLFSGQIPMMRAMAKEGTLLNCSQHQRRYPLR